MLNHHNKTNGQENYISNLIQSNFVALNINFTVNDALNHIRNLDIADKIAYFYVVNDENQLLGVISTRKLLTSPLSEKIANLVSSSDLIFISQNATFIELYETFSKHKLLALPVVDKNKRILGVINLNDVSDKALNLERKEQMDEIFETLGFRISQAKFATPLKAFLLRAPWLSATILSGITCSIIASLYKTTIAQTTALTFFLTLLLGLGESISMQSMSLAIYNLRFIHPTLKWYIKSFLSEIKTASLLAIASSVVTSAIIAIMNYSALETLTIGSSIFLIIMNSAFIGFSVPSLLHALKVDLKIAAGPIVLASADICTIIIYLSIAKIILKK